MQRYNDARGNDFGAPYSPREFLKCQRRINTLSFQFHCGTSVNVPLFKCPPGQSVTRWTFHVRFEGPCRRLISSIRSDNVRRFHSK